MDKLPSKFSPKIKSMVGWFPCVIAFEAADFAKAMKDPNFVPRSAIFNGKFNLEKGKPEYVATGKQINDTDLAAWVKDLVTSKDFKSSNQPPPNEAQTQRTPAPAPRAAAPVLDQTCANTWKLRSRPYY
jgi:hypothetical protein